MSSASSAEPKHSLGPTNLLVKALATPDVHEFRRPILQRGRLVDVGLHRLDLCDGGRDAQEGRRGRPKVAQLVALRRTKQDVLDLDRSSELSTSWTDVLTLRSR